MARRNRGRGGLTLTRAQLTALGCLGKDMPVVPTAPPPAFPPIPKRAIADKPEAELLQKIWMDKFGNYIHDTDSYVAQRNLKRNEKTSPCFLGKNYGQPGIKAKHDMRRIPAELKPDKTKWPTETYEEPQVEIDIDVDRLAVKKPKVDIEDRLEILEKVEHRDAQNKADPLMEHEEEGNSDFVDEENDYENSYFDNGETLNDDDDNLDDGPIY